MPTADERRTLLGDLLEQRRLDLARDGLHLTWREVATEARISDEALRTLRRGQGSIRPLTAVGLERALRLRPGAIADYLDGTSPDLVPDRTLADGSRPRIDPASLPAPLREIAEDPRYTEEEKIAMITAVQMIRDRRDNGHDQPERAGRRA